MRLFRYRKPSLNTLFGITRVKRSVRKATGISTIERYTKPSRIKQHYKQQLGLYSPTSRVIRQTSKGQFPKLFGIVQKKEINLPTSQIKLLTASLFRYNIVII